jgi:hypothetical protein
MLKRLYNAVSAVRNFAATTHVHPKTGTIFKTPPQSWFQHNLHPFTPDIHKLQRYQWQRLFAYGDEMTGFPSHRLLGPDAFVMCTAFTYDPYTTYVKTLGKLSIPITLRGQTSGVAYTKVKGQLIAVKASRFWKYLDIHRRNTVEFDRVRTTLLVPYRGRLPGLAKPGESRINPGPMRFPDSALSEEERATLTAKMAKNYRPSSDLYYDGHVTIRAWMYVAKPDFWEPLIDGGFLFRPARTYPDYPFTVTYSHFSHLDLNE